MRRILWLTLFIMLVAVVWVLLRPDKIWGRRVIYSETSKRTEYPGIGKRIMNDDGMILVEPVDDTQPFYIRNDERDNYPSDQFKLSQIRGGDLVYTVGRFSGWEEIPGKDDVYLVLTTNHSGTQESYRLGSATLLLGTENGVL